MIKDEVLKVDSRWELKFLAIIAGVFSLYFAQPILFPIFLVFFLYLLLNPLQEFLVNLKIPSIISAFLITGMIFALIIIGITFLLDPATEWVTKAPDFFHGVANKILKNQSESINSASELASKITNINETGSFKISLATLANSLFSLTSSAILFIGTILILLFFSLIFAQILIHKFEYFAYIRRGTQLKRPNVFLHIKNDLSIYLLTFSFICIGLGIVMTLVFWFFDLPSPFLWGVMVVFLTFIPYIGHLIGITIIFLVSMITFNNWISILMPSLAYLVISALEGQVITPMLLGNRLNLNPLIIILSMFFWEWIWGISGLVISIPFLIIVKIILGHIPSMVRYKLLFEK